MSVSLNSSFVEYGQTINKRAQIMARYLKRGLVVDLLTLMSIYHPNYLRLVIFLKIQRIQTLFRRIQYNYLNDRIKASLMEILSLIFRILLVTHYFACVWHYLGKSEYL